MHPNWTVDVMWHNTKRVRVGYACGTAAGKVRQETALPGGCTCFQGNRTFCKLLTMGLFQVRAFHLALVVDEFGDRCSPKRVALLCFDCLRTCSCRPETEWNRCKTGVLPSRAPFV